MRTELKKILDKESGYNLTFICNTAEAAAILKVCIENLEKIMARIKVYSGMDIDFVKSELNKSIRGFEKGITFSTNTPEDKTEEKKYESDVLRSLPPDEIKIPGGNSSEIKNKKHERSSKGRDIDRLLNTHKNLF